MESETVSGTGILSGLSIDPANDANGWLTDFTATKGANASYDMDYGFDAATGQLASVTHTAAGRSAHYQYHPVMNRPLHVDFRHGNTDIMRSSYLYDRAGRIGTVRSHLTGSGDVVSSHRYRYDPANRRVEAKRQDGSFWKYGYNSKGELIDSRKYLRGDEPLAGYQWDYDYDDIGNRVTMKSGGNSAGLGQQTTIYGSGGKLGAANSLNQYTGITNPGCFDVTGTDPDASSVTIRTLDTVEAQPVAGSQQAWFRFDVDSAASGTAPSWDAVTVTGSDTNETETGNHYNPPVNESLAYDFDGNLTSDGRWDYTWNGENRLIEMETSGIGVAARWESPEYGNFRKFNDYWTTKHYGELGWSGQFVYDLEDKRWEGFKMGSYFRLVTEKWQSNRKWRKVQYEHYRVQWGDTIDF